MFNSPWQKPFRGIQLNKSHPLARGLIGCWIFNEGTGDKVFDLSGSGNHGTLTSGTYWKSGSMGHALFFDGDNDYVDCGSDDKLDIQSAFTISAWIEPSSSSGDRKIYNRETGSNGIGFQQRDTALWLWVGDGDWASVTSSGLVLNSWNHVAAVHDGALMTLYIDGSPGTPASQGTPASTTGINSMIGTKSGGSGDNFSGLIGGVYIHNRALSADEIKWLHREPYAMFEQPSRAKYFDVAAAAEYSLVCDGGSFAETGQIAALLKSHLIDIGAASFAETGQVADLLKSSLVGIGAGSYALTGQAATLLKHSAIVPDSASYALAGQIVALLKSGKIVPESGVYNLTGLDLDLVYSPGEGVYRPVFRPRRR